MLILEPDGTVNNGGYASQPRALEVLTELVVAGADALDHPVHYSFDVPGIGMVALELDRDMVAAAYHPHRSVLVRGRQG